MPISLSDFSFKKLDISKPVDFDCGDADLNEFFTKDAKFYQEQLLANTYYWEKNNKIAAMFSVSNDAIQLSNREKRKTHPEKPLRAYPAVKIGRLAVSTEYQKKGLGRQVLDFLKILFLIKNKTGCRYLTVDAYNKPGTTGFYEKNDFKFRRRIKICC